MMQYQTTGRESLMKVVVIRSPRLLAGLFRLMFRMNRENGAEPFA
jgi:hypothetical protein